MIDKFLLMKIAFWVGRTRSEDWDVKALIEDDKKHGAVIRILFLRTKDQKMGGLGISLDNLERQPSIVDDMFKTVEKFIEDNPVLQEAS